MSHQYTRFEKRLLTIKNWSNSCIIPEALAEAGFYYNGNIDGVKYFSCKMEICRWE